MPNGSTDKIVRAAHATTQALSHADTARDTLTSAFTSRIVNGHGVFADPGWQRRALCEARDAIISAITAMDATKWPTKADYDVAEEASARRPVRAGHHSRGPGNGSVP
jgi:hypothetical protein